MVDHDEIDSLPESPALPMFGVLAGTLVAVLLSSSFLSFLGIAIGAAIGVKVDSSRSMVRALVVGASVGILSGIVAALIVTELLPILYPDYVSGYGNSVASGIMALIAGFAVVEYVAAALAGAALSKALWVKKSPEGIGLRTKPPDGIPRNRY